MKEELNQLDVLLKEIIRLVKQHKEIEDIDLDSFASMYESDPELDERMKQYQASFKQTIIAYKNDKEFYCEDIPKLKLLLQTSLSELNETIAVNSSSEPNDKYIISKLIERNLLNTETQIFGKFKNKKYAGYLTADGYFKLSIGDSLQSFLSFSFAAHKVCDKPTNGWKFWCAYDKYGEVQNLDYFRKELSSLGSLIDNK